MGSSTILFQQLSVSPATLVSAARKYVGGVGYSYRDSWVETDAQTGAKRGHTDCLRLLLYVAKDAGLLTTDFNPNRPRPRSKDEKPLPRDEWMLALLEENCEEVRKEEAQAGDVLLFWFNDHYHVALKSDDFPLPLGRMVEARDVEGVVEVNVMADDWKDCRSCWRIRGLTDAPQGEGD